MIKVNSHTVSNSKTLSHSKLAHMKFSVGKFVNEMGLFVNS